MYGLFQLWWFLNLGCDIRYIYVDGVGLEIDFRYMKNNVDWYNFYIYK